jgi:hypothetical protein
MKGTGNLHYLFRLTGHAQTVVAERAISLSWIARVLAAPLALEVDKDDPTLMHTLGRIPEQGDRVLRVIYNDTRRPWIIVTAFFDRKAGRNL